ncbi:MAG: diacylglycerol kinase family protein [bacterium]
MNNAEESFSIKSRIKSTTHAWRGIGLFVKGTHNSWLHLSFAILVVVLGIVFRVSIIEWLFIVVSIGSVMSSEAFNTAIEIDIDLTSPEYHPYARDTKDVAAGAVLLTSVMAFIIGLIIFVPKIVSIIK